MKDFKEKIAVITGAGTGMGRELARQLAAQGCHVAICDVLMDNLEETRCLALEGAPTGTRVTAHECDVSEEEQMLAFRDAVLREHDTESINLLFNNAGISGGGSFLNEPREQWDKTFGVCWSGVYFGSRAFLPLLVKSDEGCIVNTSSVNGFWASLGPQIPHTAYSAAKFAVKGFTEALINDLRINAPHVKAVLVMPGHIGTSIVKNSARVLGRPTAREMTAKDLDGVRATYARMGWPVEGVSDDDLRAMMERRAADFEARAPLTAADAAGIILDAVREGKWRLLVGADAERLDRLVRESPEEAYERPFGAKLLEVVLDQERATPEG